MLILKSWIEFLYRRAVLGFGGVAVVAIVIVVVTCIRVWTPDFGLTRFIPIGNEFNNRGIEAYRTAPKYVDPYPANRWSVQNRSFGSRSTQAGGVND